MERTYHLIKKYKTTTTPAPAQDKTIPFYIEDLSGVSHSFNFNNYGDLTNIEYSTDNENWSSTKPDVPANGRVYIRATGTKVGTTSFWNRVIQYSYPYNTGGNVLSFFYGSNFTGEETTFPDDTKTDILSHLFANESNLMDAKDLIIPVTTMTEYCCREMFMRCFNLLSAPQLPATTLAKGCYQAMFGGSGLQVAPELPAMVMAEDCYNSMFGSSKIVVAPQLPATTLAKGCYSGMFGEAICLTEAPDILPATTLAENCYSTMFWKCQSLITAPVLPAKTVVSNAYYDMFNSSYNLRYITVMCNAQTGTNPTHNTFAGIAPRGIIVRCADCLFGNPNDNWKSVII